MSYHTKFVLVALLSAGCSKPMPTGTTVANLTATKAAPAATVAEEASQTPTLTSHQAYLIAREYIQKEHKGLTIHEFSVRYNERVGEWGILVVVEPRRPGGFFTVCVSDKEAKVIRVDGGE